VASDTPAIAQLGPAEAHVWLDDLNAAAPWNVAGLLSNVEQSRAENMRATDRRRAFIRARSALRYLAGRYLDLPAASIGTAETSTGKPVLVLPPHTDQLHVSIAHSASLVAIAFSKAAEIGVDIEPWRERVDRAAVAKRFFGAAEAEVLASRDKRAFFDAWVCKEAVLKAVGVGLAGIGDVGLSLEGREPRLSRLGPSLGAVEKWTLSMFDVGEAWSGAVAVHAPGMAVVVRRSIGA
jgi:4'-phosphopantetheinyl transferase